MPFPELLLLVPTRGRPANVARLVAACEKTCQAGTALIFGMDEDDPQLTAATAAAAPWPVVTGPRMGLTGWTNRLALDHLEVPYLASIGDDMVPQTPGWDRLLLDAIKTRPGGAGMAYPWDGRRSDVPEAVVMSSSIVAALGWMAFPKSRHWFIDNVWADLGHGASCLTYVDAARVAHLHPNVEGGDPPDLVYNEAAETYRRDMAAYNRWRMFDSGRDIATVKGVTACSPAA